MPSSSQEPPRGPQHETDDILMSRKTDEITRKTVDIPVSNAMLKSAKLDVKHNEHNCPDILSKYGYTAVVDAAFLSSRKAQHPFFSPTSWKSFLTPEEWRFHGVQILADTPLAMLKALSDDTLAQKVQSEDPADEQLADYFDQSNYEAFIGRDQSRMTVPHVNQWIKRHKNQFAPSFYVHILADADGQSPTPIQLRRVVGRMRQYVSGDIGYADECIAIDNASRSNRSDYANISERQHYFLDGSTQRVQIILTFCEALEDLLLTHAPPGSREESVPFKHQAKYFGFTVNDTDRNKRHETGNTNWLKALYHSICKVEFHDEDGQPEFDWHHYVIGFATSVDECHIGEELFCQIGSGYYYTGLGFNIQHAGTSVNSAYMGHQTPRIAAER